MASENAYSPSGSFPQGENMDSATGGVTASEDTLLVDSSAMLGSKKRRLDSQVSMFVAYYMFVPFARNR
jgi:hypothetical protein